MRAREDTSVSHEVVIRAEDAALPTGQGLLDGFRRELVKRYGHFDEAASPSATPADFAPPSGRFLVVYVDGLAVACGGVKRLDASTGEVKRMFVAPAARGRGVSRILLTALEDAARELGYSRMRLDTGREQHEAQGLYPTAGYAEIPDYNGNPYASVWFEKTLG
jgi:GNAT superfamily N-acetyltransferase